MAVEFVATPVGVIRLESDGEFLVGVTICEVEQDADLPAPERNGKETSSSDVLERAGVQLLEYCAGHRTEFDLPVKFSGTVFHEQVWRALQTIPYGQTVTYGQIAQRIGRPRAGRAVGQAVGANPIAIVIPCHRVVGSTGKLTGFSTGLGIETKQLLLNGEGIFEYQV